MIWRGLKWLLAALALLAIRTYNFYDGAQAKWLVHTSSV